ncbi:MAG: phage tail sheath subtilisin-like domain-containing protein [Oscillospiraceae bacterium]|nr:phage tail sheath subtilisin-like domain-containing protein [Oscillospiraceae bacterium]
MGATFLPGEQKIRPGVYQRYENDSTRPVAGAEDGRCAAVFKSNWGPIGRSVRLDSFADIARTYGSGGSVGTTAVMEQQFTGGALTVDAVRLGSGGTPGTYAINDTTPKSAVKMTMLHPGSRQFSVTIRQTLDNPEISEFILLEGSTELERWRFDNVPEADQAAALVSAAAGSRFFTMEKMAVNTDALAEISQVSIVPGTDPVISGVTAYSDAFGVLESARWNVLAVDTVDIGVHAVMQQHLNRMLRGGKYVMGVIGEDGSVEFDTRIDNAAAFNDYQVVYVGTGFIDSGGTDIVDGWKAAARISGLISGTPSSRSITHTVITGASELSEQLTNAQYEQAIRSGMLAFSLSSGNRVWVESGINTLNDPGENDDAGWKKIKRTKVRFELMQRLDLSVEPLVGDINNDGDGRATVIQVGNGICNAMVAEGKLVSGAHLELDTDFPPAGDSAWFRVFSDDIDAMEKLYFTHKFRFAPEMD